MVNTNQSWSIIPGLAVFYNWNVQLSFSNMVDVLTWGVSKRLQSGDIKARSNTVLERCCAGKKLKLSNQVAAPAYVIGCDWISWSILLNDVGIVTLWSCGNVLRMLMHEVKCSLLLSLWHLKSNLSIISHRFFQIWGQQQEKV